MNNLEVTNCNLKIGLSDDEKAMPKPKSTAVGAIERTERNIYVARGQRVMLDFELARLFGVSTKAFNQAVRRNKKRFPPDFAFPLTLHEVENLRSQIVTSSSGHGGRRYRSWAFTEQGVAMLSSVLNSPTAIKVNIEIMRAFVRIRRLLATPGELVAQIAKLAETVQLHDDQIKVITEVLRQMMEPPPQPKGKFGFHMPEPSEDGKQTPERQS